MDKIEFLRMTEEDHLASSRLAVHTFIHFGVAFKVTERKQKVEKKIGESGKEIYCITMEKEDNDDKAVVVGKVYVDTELGSISTCIAMLQLSDGSYIYPYKWTHEGNIAGAEMTYVKKKIEDGVKVLICMNYEEERHSTTEPEIVKQLEWFDVVAEEICWPEGHFVYVHTLNSEIHEELIKRFGESKPDLKPDPMPDSDIAKKSGGKIQVFSINADYDIAHGAFDSLGCGIMYLHDLKTNV